MAEQDAKAILLVSLENETSKFLSTLSEVDAEPRDALVSELLEPKTGMGEPLRETWPSELVQHFDEDALVGLVERTRHFAIALRKRPGFDNSEPDHIIVGRSREADIVLRSSTVSKLHAWFDIALDGTHRVIDKGSRNGTRVNGQRLIPERAAPLSPGDVIEFGLCRAVFCPAVTFWRAVHEK